MPRRILGVDEAGRGPVLGPMVICGALIHEGDEELLAELRVRDSKLLTPHKREELYDELVSVLRAYRLVEVWPREIDEAVSSGGLNRLEARVAADLIRELRPDVAILDAPGRYPQSYAFEVKRRLRDVEVEIVAENKADANYPVVSAASILAKVHRDRIIERLREEYGDFGSGYAGDERTIRFLREWVREKGSLPPIARRSWLTASRIVTEERAGLGGYI